MQSNESWPADDDAAGQAKLNVQRFNESFYASNPADYLQTRLELMLLVGARRNELRDLLAAGLEYAGVTVGVHPGGAEAEGDNDDDDHNQALDRFLVVESQQLLHHACETALRLFLVHAARPKVPWVELAGLRDFRAFKERVEETFIATTPARDLVGWVCLGSAAATEDVSEEKWEAAVDGLTAFLREFGQRFLDEAHLYNSIKHGLGVSPGDAILVIDGEVMGAGPSIDYPESGPWTGDVRSWSLTTLWPDLTETIALTYVATQVVSSMWTLGRHRHLGKATNASVYFPDDVRPTDLRGARQAPGRRMSWRLVEERRSR
jgi:hypothetical protein